MTEDQVPGTELAVSAAGLEELEDEPFRVKTGPLEVSRGPGGSGELGEVPDWVMVGLPDDGHGVRLFASRTLTRAGLQRRVDGYIETRVGPGRLAKVPNETRVIVAVMKDFTQIRAATYPDALASLMEQWGRGEGGTPLCRCRQRARSPGSTGVSS